MNKKAFELSINFIVMLILATVVFGFGLYFVRMLFTEAGNIKAQLDKDTEDRIISLLDRGEMVAFPISTKDISQDDNAVFGLGVLNVKDNRALFQVATVCSIAVAPSGNEILDGCSGTWTINPAPFYLEKNEKKLVPIAIQPPISGTVKEGTYAFTVVVMADDKVYGSPKQIYVNIG